MQDFITFIRQYPDMAQIMGVIGFLVYIAGFFLIQVHMICGNGNLFAFSQVFAALCVLLSLSTAFNLASFLIQISYASIGLMGIAMRLRSRATPGGRHSDTHPPQPPEHQAI